jgi:hypothetical protein
VQVWLLQEQGNIHDNTPTYATQAGSLVPALHQENNYVFRFVKVKALK